jgi:hypothetical protein
MLFGSDTVVEIEIKQDVEMKWLRKRDSYVERKLWRRIWIAVV